MFNKITPIVDVAEARRRAEAIRLEKEREAKRRAIQDIQPDWQLQSLKKSKRKRKKIYRERYPNEILNGSKYNFSIDLSDRSCITIRDMVDKAIDIRLMYYEGSSKKRATKKGVIIPFEDEKIWSQFVSAINEIDAGRTKLID